MAQNILFYLAAVMAVATTSMVVITRNAVYAVLYLIMSLFAVALVFLSLNAPFLALVEIIVYAGAIMVLFLFVVMMLNLQGDRGDESTKRPTRQQMLIPGGLALLLLILVVVSLSAGTPSAANEALRDPKLLGELLFTKHYLGVKLSGIILLIGTIGGLHIGRGGSIPSTLEKPIDDVTH